MSQLPQGWESIQLKQLITLNKKFKDLEDDLDCGFVPMSNVPTKLNEKLTYEPKKWGDCKKGYTHFQNGDVLLAKITPCFENGKSVLVSDLPNGVGAGSTEYFVMRPNGIDSRYLHAFVKTKEFVDSCTVHMSGSVGHKRVPKDYLLNYMVPVAPVNEQKRIADKLGSVLAKVEAAQARLDKIPIILKRFRQSVLAAATSGELTKDWRDGREFGKKISIGELTKDIKYGTSKKCDYNNEHTPVLRIPNISNGVVKPYDMKYAQFDDKELENLSLKTGDILVIRSNGSVELVGKSALICEGYQGYLYAGYLIRLRLSDYKKALPAYLNIALQSPQLRKVIELNARSTSGVNNINSKELAALSFFLPNIKEQKEIITRVSKLFEQAELMERKYASGIAHLNSLTQSILSKAFSGRL